MQELFPPVQMYIILAIVATLCTIIAAKIKDQKEIRDEKDIRDRKEVQLKGTFLVARVLITVASISVLQILFILTDRLDVTTPGLWILHVVFHTVCILILLVLLITWYFRSISPRSQLAG